MALKTVSEDFIRELSVIEGTLEKVARKLEEEFADRFQGSGVNPMALAKRIQKLQASLPELKDECQALIERKQELIDAAKQQLITNHARLQQLGSRCGVQLDVDSEGYAAFSHAISEWDASQVQSAGQEQQYSRGELNKQLAGSMLI